MKTGVDAIYKRGLQTTRNYMIEAYIDGGSDYRVRRTTLSLMTDDEELDMLHDFTKKAMETLGLNDVISTMQVGHRGSILQISGMI